MKQKKMNEPADNLHAPESNRQVAEVKAAAARHNRLTAWVLGGAFLACVGVGLALWIVEPASDRDNLHLGFSAGAAAMIFFLVALGGRMLFPKPEAICPQCGCDWNVESDNDTQRWMAWSCCPGCGLNMCEESQDETRRDPAKSGGEPGTWKETRICNGSKKSSTA